MTWECDKIRVPSMSDFTPLEDQIRECFGRVVYSHKTHEKMAEGCARALQRYKWTQIILSGLTASSAFSALLESSPFFKIATAVLSIVTIWMTGYLKNFDPGGSAQKHRDAAASLWVIRESYLTLLTDLRMRSIPDAEAEKRRGALQTQLAAIYKGAPHTNGKAYAEAQVALQKNEEYTFSDAEIDKCVPSSLRKTGE